MTEFNKDYLSRTEAAALAGVKPRTIDAWLREPGGPRFMAFRRQIRIPKADFQAWLAAQLKEGGR